MNLQTRIMAFDLVPVMAAQQKGPTTESRQGNALEKSISGTIGMMTHLRV